MKYIYAVLVMTLIVLLPGCKSDDATPIYSENG